MNNVHKLLLAPTAGFSPANQHSGGDDAALSRNHDSLGI